jgi:DNA-binding transcriptional regulator YiaG
MKIYKNLDINNLENEIWKIIENFSDYQVSNLGRIKSFKRDKINGKIKKQTKNNRGYLCTQLWKNGKYENIKIHRLLYETFNEYKLKSDEIVHHIDFINIIPEISKENNKFDNLIKMPKKEHIKIHSNGEYNSMFGVKRPGEKSGKHKLTEEKVIQIKLLLKEGKLTQQEIADMFNISKQTISHIKKGITWSYIII